jgi:pSer/pThr/pTyr-binding forkhead associated (FHA) protein
MPPVRAQPDPSTPSLQPVGQHQGQQPLTLGRLVTLIGSSPSARLYLPSKAVSRCHAAVIHTGGVVFIRDLASRTRTRVNGRPVKEAELSDGDVIEVSKFAFRFTRPSAAAPALPQPPAPRPPLPPGALEIEGLDEPVPLDARALLIGRRETADISLTENAASSAHALVLVADGKHLVRDLNSRTGTFVNGVKVHEHVLSPGDVIRVGETSFRYIKTAGAAPRPDVRPAKQRPPAQPPALAAEAPITRPVLTDAAADDDRITVDVAPELPVAPAAAGGRPPAGSAGDDINNNGVGVLELAEAAREPESREPPVDGGEPAPEAGPGGAAAAPAETPDDLELATDDLELATDDLEPATGGLEPATDDLELAPDNGEPESTASPGGVFDTPGAAVSSRSDFVYEGFENDRAEDSAPGPNAAAPAAVPPPSDKRRRWSDSAAAKSDRSPPGKVPVDPFDVLGDIEDLEPLPHRPPPAPPAPPHAPHTPHGRD